MFKINLKIAFRNLLRNKVYTAINIGGLAIGLTSFILLLLFVNHENSYDKWDPQLKNIYQIREFHDFHTPDNKQYWQELNDTRIANLVAQNISQFSVVTKVDKIWGWNEGFSVKVEGKNPIVLKNIRDADSAFFEVFPFKFVQGDPASALKAKNNIVLKEDLARKIFGSTNAIGKMLKIIMWQDDPGTAFTVAGVVVEPDGTNSLEFDAIFRTGELDVAPTNPGNSHFSEVYALAKNDVDTALVNKNLEKTYIDFKKASFTTRKITYNDYYKNGKAPGLKAIPLSDVHGNPPFDAGWVSKIKPIIYLAIFLLLISVINFINLATAQSIQRAKEVGVKKVLGAYTAQLVNQFMLESMIQTITALFLSVVLVELFLPLFGSHFNVSLSFWHNAHLISLLFQLLGLFVLVTLLAGFYPALVLSKYNPAKVLKGNYESSFKGVFLRNGLVVLQFVIAVTFLITIGIIHMQTNFISSKDLGFKKEGLINISSGFNQSFADRIKKIPGVKYVATTTQVMGGVFNVPNEIYYNKENFNLNTVTVTMEALDALGAKVVSGRLFSPEYKQDTVNSVVLNEAAANLLGKDLIGKTYSTGKVVKFNFQIIGVIKNYHNEGFDKAVLPTVYKVTHLGGMSNMNNLLVRFDTENYARAIQQIEAEWKKVYPNYPMRYTAIVDAFEQQILPTKRLLQITSLFSAISIALSLLGLFALSAFMAKKRTKEIAIRKILGASNRQVIHMLNRSFLILVVLANLISWPIAFMIGTKWLQGFAYRINMPVVPFFVAAITSLIVSVLTVSIQARKAAVNNPVKALKYE